MKNIDSFKKTAFMALSVRQIVILCKYHTIQAMYAIYWMPLRHTFGQTDAPNHQTN